MTFDDPGDGIFDHLDDPAPPLHGSEALTHVVQRGQQIRRRRRSAYSSQHRGRRRRDRGRRDRPGAGRPHQRQPRR